MQILSRLPEVKVSFQPIIKSKERERVSSSWSAFKVFQKIWDMQTISLYEEAKVLYLDRANGVIGFRNLNRGATAATVIDTKLIFSIALKCNACGIILCHNHPSGRLIPSSQDNELTKQIKAISDFMGVKLHDHLIITEESYYSYNDEGKIF